MWDLLRDRALDAARGGVDADAAVHRLLSASGGDRRMFLAARMRLAAELSVHEVDLDAHRALDLIDEALARGDSEGLWHPVLGDLDPWQFARHHTPR
ncbi:MAG: hypothetical protein JWP02_261 [Acidimicrobiales bacterium]|nr:hypothetical protein [Acidimicrobiales bacterium]